MSHDEPGSVRNDVPGNPTGEPFQLDTEASQGIVEKLVTRVDRLETATLLRRKNPWYKATSTIISMIALFFSLGTTAISYYRTAKQDVLTSRVELRTLIEELTSTPEKHAQMTKNFRDDPRILAELSMQINNRNLVLVKQAAAVIERLESSVFGRGSVLAVEYGAVAAALSHSFLYDEANLYFQEAAKRATDPTAAAGALRSSAGIAMARNDIDAMRQLMQEALEVFRDPLFSSAAQVTKDVTNATTELQWGLGEIQTGACDQASDHGKQAEPLILRVPQGQLRDQLTGLLEQLMFALANCG